MTPIVRMTTLKICNREYFFPTSQPAPIVVTLPKLRRMMCTGTLMLNENAQLLSMLTAKNIAAPTIQRRIGTEGFLMNIGREGSYCEGYAESAEKMNCISVMRRP